MIEGYRLTLTLKIKVAIKSKLNKELSRASF